MWTGLRNRALGGHKFVRQERIGPYSADFACREARLVVEIDGATHSTDREVAHDKARESFIRAQGYRVVRFTNGEVYEQADAVFDAIFAALGKAAMSGPSLACSCDRPLTLPLPTRSGERGARKSVRPTRYVLACTLLVGVISGGDSRTKRRRELPPSSSV